MRGLGVGWRGQPRREAEAVAPPAFGSAPLALLFENGMATEGQMEEEMGAGRGQGAAVQPELWGSAGGTEVVCVQGVRGLGSVLPSPAYCSLLPPLPVLSSASVAAEVS